MSSIFLFGIKLQILIHRFARRESELEQMNEVSLYPTEELIWDENRVPTEYYSGEGCLALPKLGLQFLTLQDYLLRNFNLFRLESTYEIRQVCIGCATSLFLSVLRNFVSKRYQWDVVIAEVSQKSAPPYEQCSVDFYSANQSSALTYPVTSAIE